jgi:hypothetical protein
VGLKQGSKLDWRVVVIKIVSVLEDHKVLEKTFFVYFGWFWSIISHNTLQNS